MTDPTPLSPAAQAVLDAALDVDFCIEFTDLDVTMKASVQSVVATALRTASAWTAQQDARADLLTIAAELEGSNA